MKLKNSFILSVIIVTFISSLFLGGVFLPRKAEAVAAVPAIVAQTANDIFQWIKDGVKSLVTNLKEGMVTNVLLSGLDMFAQNYANQVGQNLASGNVGLKSLVRSFTAKDAIENAAAAAAGDMIGILSQPFEELGLNLCDPSLDVKVAITGSLIKSSSYSTEEPECDWNDIVNNWSDFQEELKGMTGKQATESTLSALRAAFSPSSSAFSLSATLNDELIAKSNEAEAAEKIEVTKSDYLTRTNATGTRVLTGADEVERVAETKFDTAQTNNLVKWLTTSLHADTAVGAIAARAVSTLANSFSSTLINRILNSGSSFKDDGKSTSSAYCGNGIKELSEKCDKTDIPATCKSLGYASGTLSCTNSCQFNVTKCVDDKGNPGVTEAIAAYCGDGVCNGSETYNTCSKDCDWPSADVTYSDINFTSLSLLNDYDPLSDYVLCPTQTDVRTIDNCVIGKKFYSALNRAEPITVAKAIELRLLDGNSPLYSVAKQATLADAQSICYNDALCYSNLQKLRLLRVIPLGWEIAAERSPVDNPVTLGEVIDCFDDSGESCSDYYKLIDPDWILKAPLAQCQAVGYGPKLQAKLDVGRAEVCVDTRTCLKEDDNGNCLSNAWGYCTREENVWRLGGDQCDAVYASCQEFSRGSEKNYYIKDSLDLCTASEVGCQLYSTAKLPTGDWSTAEEIYLNNQASSCDSSAVGCTELIKLEPGMNLISNGSFEDGNADQWEFDYSWAVTTEAAWSGSYSFKSQGYDNSAEYSLGGLAAGNNYTLSLYVKSNYAENFSLMIDGESASGTGETDWQKVIVTFIATSNQADLQINFENGAGYVDDVMLELGDSASDYVDYNDAEVSYMQKAPDYLGCQDNPEAAGCEKYALYCTETELGCELYTPVTGDPAIPGIVSSDDYCPAECVNYQQYLKEATLLEEQFGDSDPNSYRAFIASTGQTCSLSEVGCEEFTDINTEASLYFKELQFCVQDTNPNVGIFFTWEGSDTTGIQLRDWSLLKSNVDAGPCTNVVYNVSSGTNVCTDTVVTINNCSGDETNSNCRLYVNENNEEFLREEARVVKASEDCSRVRRSLNNDDLAMILPKESASCSAQAVGCHIYKGNDGSNVRQIFLSDFEDGVDEWSGGVLSSDSSVTGGHSLKVSKVSDSEISKEVYLTLDKTYTISLWLKSDTTISGDVNIYLSNSDKTLADLYLVYDTPIVVGNDWQRFDFGPVYYHYDSEPDDSEAVLTISLSNFSSYYVDNIILKETKSDFYLIEGSWNTPTSCYDPSSMLGCQEYTDRANNVHYLRSFSSLCGEDQVGCSMFIDTKNTAVSGEQTHARGDGTNVVIPADEIVYLVDNPDYYCAEAERGCSLLGEQNYTFDSNGNQVAAGWSEVYLLNDPDNYDLTVCSSEVVGCSVYTSGGETVYLRAPGNNTCSYRNSFEFGGKEYSAGWYRTYSLESNPTSCSVDGTYDLPSFNETDFAGSAGLCTAAANGCTEFVDPQGTQTANLIYNGNFELNTNYPTNPDKAPDYWCVNNPDCSGFFSWSGSTTTTAGAGRDGSEAVSVKYSTEPFNQVLTSLEANQIYVVSVDLKARTSLDYLEEVSWFAKPAQAAVDGRRDFKIGLSCTGGTISSYDNSFVVSGATAEKTIAASAIPYDQKYYTVSAKFSLSAAGSCTLKLGGLASDEYWLDNVRVSPVKSYYYIDGKEISGTICNGQVSWDQGCILVQDTSLTSYTTGEVTRSYNSTQSYLNSQQFSGGLVNAVSCNTSGNTNDVGCDANRIIKVTKDRECAEWLACRSSSLATQADGSIKEYCYDLGRCTEIDAAGECLSWVAEEPTILTADNNGYGYTLYQDRETGWQGREYSGFSLLDKYNLDALLAKSTVVAGENTYQLSKESEDNLGVVGVDGVGTVLNMSCRLFPESDSPFSPTSMEFELDDTSGSISKRPEQMPQANFCHQGDACECSYQKVTYENNEIRYYDLDYAGVPESITIDRDSDLKSYIKSISKYEGFWGFCLEPDYLRPITGYVDPNYSTVAGVAYPCTTWVPLDILSGEYSIAGANIAGDLGITNFDSLYYCAQAEGNVPYSSQTVMDNSIYLGTDAVEDPGSGSGAWRWDTCGGIYQVYLPGGATNLYPSDDSLYPTTSTLALCLVNNLAVNDSNQNQGDEVIIELNRDSVEGGVSVWNPNYSYSKGEINSVEFNNIVAGSSKNVYYETDIKSYLGFINNNQEVNYYCPTKGSSDVSTCLSGAGGLLDLPNGSTSSSAVVLNRGYEFDCDSYDTDSETSGIQTINGVFCEEGDETIWIRMFYATDVYDSNGAYGTADSIEWIEFDPYAEDELAAYYANDCLSSGLGSCIPYLFAASAHNNLGLAFVVGFDSDGDVRKYEIVGGQNHSFNDEVNHSHGFIYSLNVKTQDPNSLATEICTDVVKVDAPKFTDFVYGTDVTSSYQAADRNVGINDWYGLIDLPSGFGGWTSLNQGVYVESLEGHDSSLPYIDVAHSVSDSGEISYNDGYYSGPFGGHYFGVTREVDNGSFLTLAKINAREGNSGLTAVIEALKKIFAKITTIFRWNGSRYESNSSFNVDTTHSGGEKVQVKQVNWNKDFNRSEEGESGITINGYQGGNIEVNKGTLNATMTFYAYNESGNQMPLKHLVVDWGDGSEVGSMEDDLSLKNHQEVCVNYCSDSIVEKNDKEYFVDGRFVAGDQITIEYEFDYFLSSSLFPEGIHENFWGYDADDWEQWDYNNDVPLNDGQKNKFPRLVFDPIIVTSAGSGCPEGTTPTSGTNCKYVSTRVVPNEMISSCYYKDNLSGYCFGSMAGGLETPLAGSLAVKDINIYIGCRQNSDCQFTKYGTLGTCEPLDIGDNLKYCVDDLTGGLGYFSFNHTYICSDPTDTEGIDTSETSCIYQPKIYVEDNWGWCSEGYGVGECISLGGDIVGWREYGGQIILTP